MVKSDTPREEHRAFTIRVPLSLYEQIGDLAISEGMPVNIKVNMLIRLGLDKHVSLDVALARLLKKEVINDQPAA